MSFRRLIQHIHAREDRSNRPLALPAPPVSDASGGRLRAQVNDGARNSAPAHFVVIGVDNSGSMNEGGALAQLKAGLSLLRDNVQGDPLLASRLLLALTKFGTSQALEVLAAFRPAPQFEVPEFSADTATPLCEAILEEVKFLRATQEQLQRQFDRDTFQSWAIRFSDGRPTDMHLFERAIQATHVTAAEAGIEYFFFGVGDRCDMAVLRRLAQPDREAMHVKDVEDFRRCFLFLYQALRAKSQSIVGQDVELRHPFDDDLPPLRSRG